MSLNKPIYWDIQHLAGYYLEKQEFYVILRPLADGMEQRWSKDFFDKLVHSKQLLILNFCEYEKKVAMLADAMEFLGEKVAREQFQREGL